MRSLYHTATSVLRETRGILADFWADPNPKTVNNSTLWSSEDPPEPSPEIVQNASDSRAHDFVLQEVMWGSGEVFTSGELIAKRLIAPLTLNETQAFLDLNAGLGTWASHLQETYGTHFTGLVWGDALARYRVHWLAKHNRPSSITCVPCTPRLLPALPRVYDGAVARMVFSTLKDKEPFIHHISKHLTANAQISFAEYTVESASSDQDIHKPLTLEAENALESDDVFHPNTLEDIQNYWNNEGFTLSVTEDITENYTLDLCEGLIKLHNYLTEHPASGDRTVWIVREVSRLEKRLRALATGLRVNVFYGKRG